MGQQAFWWQTCRNLNDREMKKIIVTTDLSKNSKSGAKFAIQLASQYDMKLIFFYALELLVPTRWNDVKVKTHMDDEIKTQTNSLQKFVAQIYKECKRRPGKYDCVVRYGASVSEAILEYATDSGASYICMGTHGAGKLRQIVGTHTSTVIKKSFIPVFAIPKNYKTSVIKEILYASDFTALRSELLAVRNFAKKVDSSISVLHYDYFVDPKASRKSFDRITSQQGLPGINFHLEKYNLEEPMNWHLKKAVRKFRADVIAMFTDNKRSWFQNLLLGSNSVDASLASLSPILVYPR
jgi:nucleotide-binding universal stress UspA family protein